MAYLYFAGVILFCIAVPIVAGVWYVEERAIYEHTDPGEFVMPILFGITSAFFWPIILPVMAIVGVAYLLFMLPQWINDKREVKKQ